MIVNRRVLMSLFGAAATIDAKDIAMAKNAPIPIVGTPIDTLSNDEEYKLNQMRENHRKLAQAERIAAGDFRKEDLHHTKLADRAYHYQSLKSLSDCGRQFLVTRNSELQHKKDLIKRAQTEIKRFKKHGFINWVSGMEEDI